ncbi:hypothetical protein FH972_027025 [Carpinus fangiana]|uniref:Uncharacterized protein n=1 Tax=Carpinus fangiana TaxID=176857 RepID=A0A5N6L623_9ROSI|nr:hypothetical protein FH972_027025 [Carpinus fangiana]
MLVQIWRSIHSIPFATVDVGEISGSQPAEVHNLSRSPPLVQGKWKGSSSWNTLLDPLNGEPFIKVAEVDETGLRPFIESLSKCPKPGLHNPFKEPERYLLFGDISAKGSPHAFPSKGLRYGSIIPDAPGIRTSVGLVYFLACCLTCCHTNEEQQVPPGLLTGIGFNFSAQTW